MLICQICKKEILANQSKKFVANDRPFFTFYMYKDCESIYTHEYWETHLNEFVLDFNRPKSKKMAKNVEKDYNIEEEEKGDLNER